jgi:hypothetical protein
MGLSIYIQWRGLIMATNVAPESRGYVMQNVGGDILLVLVSLFKFLD